MCPSAFCGRALFTFYAGLYYIAETFIKVFLHRFMKMSKGYEDEQHTLQAEADKIQNELQQEEKKSVDVKRFLAIVKKYTDLTELTPEILREFIDKIIVHAPDKSSGRRLQEIEIIYNHIGEFDHSKVTLWKGNAV